MGERRNRKCLVSVDVGGLTLTAERFEVGAFFFASRYIKGVFMIEGFQDPDGGNWREVVD